MDSESDQLGGRLLTFTLRFQDLLDHCVPHANSMTFASLGGLEHRSVPAGWPMIAADCSVP